MISVRYEKLMWILFVLAIAGWSIFPGETAARSDSGSVPMLLSINSDNSSVTLYGSEPLHYTTFQLNDPLRLVVDIPQAEVSKNVVRELAGNNRPIIKIQTQAVRKKDKNLARIQIYLSELTPHRVYKRGKMLTISFPLNVSLKEDMNGNYQPPPDAAPQTGSNSRNPGSQAQYNYHGEGGGSGGYYSSVVTNPYYFDGGGDANAQEWGEQESSTGGYEEEYTGYTEESSSSEETSSNASEDSTYYKSSEIIQGSATGAATGEHDGLRTSAITAEDLPYQGESMTLDVVDADIVKIFTQMTALAGKNIVVDPDVRGEITLRMENAPWDQILAYILKVHDLGIEEEGNVIRIAKRTKLKRERDEERQLREAEKLAKETRTEIIYLSYARAGDLSSKVKQLLSKRGDIIVDTRTNSLIITDIPEYLQAAKRLISTLDIKNKQVTIYAQIVSSRKSFSRSLGIQWGGGFRFGPDTGNPGKYAFPYYGGISDGSYLTNTSPFAINLPPTDNSVPFFGLVFGNVMDTFQLNLALHAAESEGVTRTVANPRITTSDNVSADIRSGVEIPYTVLTDRGVTTDFRAATISINVTPHITVDENISMRVRVTNDSVDRSFSPPGKIVNSANTELLVGNGDTFVIGGLNQTEAGTSAKKFPWLHRIPGIGKLFRSNEIGNTFNDLLIFVTPQIVEEEEREGIITKEVETIQEDYQY